MNTNRHLTDECRGLLLRAGELAAAHGGQITSSDYLAAIAESDSSSASIMLATALTANDVDPVTVRVSVLDGYAVQYPNTPLQVPDVEVPP